MTKIDIDQWAPVVGDWRFGDGAAFYTAPSPFLDRPFGVAISAVRLTEGEAEGAVVWPLSDTDKAARLLLGYRSPSLEYYTVGLGGYQHAYVISRFDPAFGWSAVALAGLDRNLSPGSRYELRVRIRGQRILFDVDGIPVLDHVLSSPLPEGQLGLFAWGHDPITFQSVSANVARGKAFVVMQLDGTFEELYRDVIVPVAQTFELKAFHAGDVFGPGFILSDITSSIVESKVVIAEITAPNPNVFYEVGYAHALGKPTILLAEKGKKLPFDVSGYRCLFYENSIGGKRKVEESLRKHLEALFGPR